MGIADDVRQRQSGHSDRAVMDQIYTKFTPEYRSQFYQNNFLDGAEDILKNL